MAIRRCIRLARCYTSDGRIDDWPPGRRSIAEHYQQEWKQTDRSCTGRWLDLKVIGGAAVGWGEDVCRPSKQPYGARMRSQWLSVLERQADGEWFQARTSLTDAPVDDAEPTAARDSDLGALESAAAVKGNTARRLISDLILVQRAIDSRP